jgi:hypothetical protein
MTVERGVGTMRNRQRGITFIGWLVLLLPLAVVVYGGIRLAPVYLNYTKVARALERTAVDFQGTTVNPQLIRNSLEKRLDIEMVDFPTVKEVVIRREGQAWVLETSYEDEAPLFSNVSLLVACSKRVELR